VTRQIKRRDFLKEASALSIGGTLLHPSRISLGTERSIRVGVIAKPTGDHLQIYLKTLGECEGVEQVALADPTGETFERARSLLGRHAATLQTFRDYREILRTFRPGMALITVEPHEAPAAVEAALEQGCHVFVEKPPCVRLADFERVARLAKSKNLHLMVALTTTLCAPSQKARELVQNGFLGKLYGADMHWIAGQTRLKNPKHHSSWKAFRAQAGGGELIYHGIHYLDLIEFIARDKITKITGFCANVGGQPIEVEDSAVVALGFKSGMVGTLNTGFYLDRGYNNLVALWGSQGWLRFDQPAGTPLEWYSTHPDAPRGPQYFHYQNDPPGYDFTLRTVVNVARGTEKPFIDADQGLHILRVIFGAYRAAETGTAQTVA